MPFGKDKKLRLNRSSILQGWAVIVSLKLVYAFNPSLKCISRAACRDSLPNYRQLSDHIILSTRDESFSDKACTNSLHKRRRNLLQLLSVRDSIEDEDTSDSDDDDDEGTYNFDGLYSRFSRQEQNKRRRTRDRIKDWMSSGKRPPSSMVQPIRMEDGSIMDVEPQRTEAGFDKLFAGMPGLDDILSPSKGAEEESYSNSIKGNAPTEATDASTSKTFDDSWFEEERQRIEQEYEQILEDTKAKLAQERQNDPENFPENADGVIESVVKQDMEKTISSMKTAMAKEQLQSYEVNRMSDLNSKDLTGVSDELVESILKQNAKDWEQKEALQAQVDDYERHEQSRFETFEEGLDEQALPGPDANLDEWALERLEGMLKSVQQGEDDESEVMISDILEENIDELRAKIELESGKSSIKPQSMKEWQMYRAIATRISNQKGNEANIEADTSEEDEEEIAAQLESWKQYIGKEKVIRDRSGLSMGPKMPFEWQQPGRDPLDTLETVSSQSADERSPREVRREVNLKAIKAMENLVERSDSIRAESLKKGLELLKAELEPRDYHDRDEEEENDASEDTGPIDISDIFSRDESDKEEANPLPDSPSFDIDSSSGQGNLNPPDTPFFAALEDDISESSSNTAAEPPKTPFFSDDEEDNIPEPPKTAFFSEEVDEEVSKETLTSSKLGTGEEQKLQAMYRRANARTKEEQDSIREQWEAFKAVEKEIRDQSGLSDGDDSGLFDQANVKYDVADVVKEDGDIDAEKILSTIGPRPKRKKAGTSSLDMPQARGESSDGNVSDDDPTKSNLDPGEVYDSIYRSIAAVGGGRTKDDPSAKEEEKTAYEEFLQKENELRQNLDSLDEDAAEKVESMDDSVDDVSYAEDALATLGPRPKIKRQRKQILDEGEFSDRGGALSHDDDDGEASDDIVEASDDSEEDKSTSDPLPEWLKQERGETQKNEGYYGVGGKFLGSEIDQMFDDDNYDKNQRQLAEYERRRAGEKRQMGIDISDVLGRTTDDYADYNYDNDLRTNRGEWGTASFEARKANLLEYTELSTIEVNNLMDHRDSVYSTGVSQYLPRISKPFEAFGAVFRLEGVLIDITGLHQEAWRRVAAEYEFRQPMDEDIRRAAVTRPDIAIREIFFWTDDVIQSKNALASYQNVMKEVFDEWAKAKGLAPNLPNPSTDVSRGTMALGDDLESEGSAVAPLVPKNEKERMLVMSVAWSQTAEEFGFEKPVIGQVMEYSVLSPDIAVREGFQWSSDSNKIDMIVSFYSRVLQGLMDDNVEGVPPAAPSSFGESGSSGSTSESVDENTMLELQFKVWTKLAEETGKEAPTAEEVHAASVLNDPEQVIRSGFGWFDDSDEVRDLAGRYGDMLAEFVNDEIHGRSFEVPVSNDFISAEGESVGATESDSDDNGPSYEEVLAAQAEAWKVTAATHNFSPPSMDDMQLTVNMSADDAVRRLLAWSFEFNDSKIKSISATYENALIEASQKLLKKYELDSNIPEAETDLTPKVEGPSDDEFFEAMYNAWVAVAKASGFSMPDQDQVLFAMAVGPEEAIITGFQWTDDLEEATKIVNDYKEQMKPKRAEWEKRSAATRGSAPPASKPKEDTGPKVRIIPDVDKWVKSLRDVGMGCGVASFLDQDQVDVLLHYTGLDEYFPPEKRVTAGNGYDRDSQQMLGVALRVERRPDHCVVFDSSPYASTAAHEVEMRSVSMVGAYPRYDLLSADSSALSFDELTTMNIRRLFGERVYDQPLMDVQPAQPKEAPKTKTRFWEDD